MRLLFEVLCFSSLFLSAAQAYTFWDDFYVFFGGVNVHFPGNVTGNTVELGLTNKTGTCSDSDTGLTLISLEFMVAGSMVKQKLPMVDTGFVMFLD